MNTCPNHLHRTFLISFPRSGHHLLVRAMLTVVHDRIVYSEYYGSDHNFGNCEFVNLQKSHDFDLTLPINPEYRYIVLYRDFDPAAESWYKATSPDMTLDEFKDLQRPYYDDFCRKWIHSKIRNRISLKYEPMIKSLESCTLSALNLMGILTYSDEQKLALDRFIWGNRLSLQT